MALNSKEGKTMTKRVTALIIALIIPLTLIFTACGSQSKAVGEPMTIQAYYDESYKCFKEFMSSSVKFTELAMKWRYGNAEDIASLKEIIKHRETAYDGLEKLNPPPKYKDTHKKILRSLKYEKDWDKAVAEYETAKSQNDLDKIGKKLEKIVGDEKKEYFPSLYFELTHSLNKEPGIVKPSLQ